MPYNSGNRMVTKMNNADNTQYRDNIEKVARLVQMAFIEIRRSLQCGTLSEPQKTAIASLPLDAVTGAAENRLAKFPNDCCMDAANVLAVIFLAFAEQNGFRHGQIHQIRCRPTDKTKNVMFDFHQWLAIGGYHIDITFEQCKAVLKGNEGKVIFDTHPLIGSDDYIYESGNAVMEEPFKVFANFVIENYFNTENN